jgi:hypothetical protein
LSQHGLIASANGGRAAMTITSELVRVGVDYFGPLPADACAVVEPPRLLTRWAGELERELQNYFPALAVRAATRSALLRAALPGELERWLTAGPLVPDDVVYGGKRVWRAQGGQAPSAWLKAEMSAAPMPGRMIVVVAGLGVILVGPHPKFLDAMEENLLAHVLIRQLIARRGGHARSLPPDEVDYLLAMESEHYRQAVAAGAA